MRYLVFSDVHANLEALDAVLAEGARRRVDAHLFLGDLVGYGPNPLECIGRLRDLQQRGSFAWVAGNHDRVARGEVEPEGYSIESIRTLDWTRRQLERERWAGEFLRTAHLTAQVNNQIWLAHDSLADPGCGGYHRYPQLAKRELASLRLEGGTICFYGHTHRMRTELLRRGTGIVMVPMDPQEREDADPRPVRLERDDLAWVGAGSVGFPVHPTRRAEYLILDDGHGKGWTVEKYSVAYPRELTRARIREILIAPCGADVAEAIARWI